MLCPLLPPPCCPVCSLGCKPRKEAAVFYALATFFRSSADARAAGQALRHWCALVAPASACARQ